MLLMSTLILVDQAWNSLGVAQCQQERERATFCAALPEMHCPAGLYWGWPSLPCQVNTGHLPMKKELLTSVCSQWSSRHLHHRTYFGIKRHLLLVAGQAGRQKPNVQRGWDLPAQTQGRHVAVQGGHCWFQDGLFFGAESPAAPSLQN